MMVPKAESFARTACVVSAMGLVSLVHCGEQKDPEEVVARLPCSDEGTPDWTDVPVAESLFPLVDGATWTYAHTGGDTDWDEVVTVTANSDGTFLVSDTPGPSGSRSESTFSPSGTMVLRTFKEEIVSDMTSATVEYDPGFLRFDNLWSGYESGCTTTYEYSRTEWDSSGALESEDERAHTFTVESVDVSVTTPAGSFEDCIVVYRARAVTGADDEDSKRFWFCPGVGKVREEEETTGKIEALVSCSVPGGQCP